MKPAQKTACGFTLIELLTATAVLILLLALLMSMVSSITASWQRSEGQKERQISARIVMAMIQKDLQAAIFLDKDDDRLQFIVNPSSLSDDYPSSAFWQMAAGANGTNTDVYEVGYFIQWPPNQAASELCRYRVPASDTNSIIYQPNQWLTTSKVRTYAPGSLDDSLGGLIMEKVLGFWIRVYDADGNPLPNYDSRTAAVNPASADIEIVVVDSVTARRITDSDKAIIQSLAAQSEDALTFINQLPATAKTGSRVFQSHVRLNTP